MGIAALVVGIMSVLAAIFGGPLSWIGTLLGITGIVLSVQGKRIPDQRGMATAGFILSIIGIVLSLLMFLACVACIGALGSLNKITM